MASDSAVARTLECRVAAALEERTHPHELRASLLCAGRIVPR